MDRATRPAGTDFRYEFHDSWARLPDGWRIGDVGGVAVDLDDHVYVFNRGAHPMMVFDRTGELIDAWGEDEFTSPHGLHLGWDGHLYCTDDGDHTVRKFDIHGKLLLEIGMPGQPSGFMSGLPFNRCTHSALSPSGEIYVCDGYRNACVHCFSSGGKLLRTWGKSGSGQGEFYVPHNLLCDRAGTVYVADRENHRIQLFDASGRWRAQWNDLHRPMALCMQERADGAPPIVYVGEAGPLYNASFPRLGPRISVLDAEGCLLARFGDTGFGHAPDRLMAPHGIAVDSQGDLYVGEVAHAAWPSMYPGEPLPPDLRTLRKLKRVMRN